MTENPTTNSNNSGQATMSPPQPPDPLPTDVGSLADLIRVMPDGPTSDPKGDLWERLNVQVGYTAASQLWQAACIMLDHESENVAIAEELGVAFDDAVKALDRIAAMQKRLAEVGDIEYLEGDGVHAANMIRRVQLDLRAARALHRAAAQP